MAQLLSESNNMTRAWPGVLRIALGVVLLLFSLLNLFPAPAFALWLAAIVVSEYSVFWILLSLLLLLGGLGLRRFRNAGTWILFIAILLFVIPLVEALVAASDFPTSFVYQFPAPGFQAERGGQPASGSQAEQSGHQGVNSSPASKAMSVHSPGSLSHNSAAVMSPEPLVSPINFVRLFDLGHDHFFPFKNLEYSKVGGIRLTLDFYQPSGTGLTPCVVVIHGGAWSGGNSQQLPELNSVLAAKGYAVASVNYRLAPASQSPAPLEDVKNALSYLSVHAAELHIDTGNIVLLGRSAGAQIALLAAYTLHSKNIRGVVDFYGPADMIFGYSRPSNPRVLNSRKVMEDYLGGTYSQVPDAYRQSSPIEFATVSSPPTLILHGGDDVLVDFEHSRRLNNKLHLLGVRHYLLTLPWATHGFDYNLNGPGGQLSTYLVEGFLKSVIKPPVSPN